MHWMTRNTLEHVVRSGQFPAASAKRFETAYVPEVERIAKDHDLHFSARDSMEGHIFGAMLTAHAFGTSGAIRSKENKAYLKSMPDNILNMLSSLEMPPVARNRFKELCKKAIREQYRSSLAK